jgi:site-specific DNA-methyltransferase (adenine-specific)
MITSPPYNVSKEYDEDLSIEEYLLLLKRSFAETYRVLVNGGRACINVANLGRKPYILCPIIFHR